MDLERELLLLNISKNLIGKEKVCELIPDLAEPHYFLGVIYQRCSDDAAALEEYKQAMELDRSHPQYLLATSETLVALGEFEEATELIESASSSFQHQPAIHALLGHIYLRKGDFEKGAHYLSDSILLGNDDIETLQTLSNAYYQAGNYGDCLDVLKQIENKTKGLSSHNTRVRAKCLVSTGRVIKGRDLCLEATRMTPQNVSCWVDLGYIAWEMGDYRRLDDCGKRIGQLNEKLPEAALFQGIAALNLGDGETAAKMLSKVKSDNTNAAFTALMTTMQVKSLKTGLETPIGQNTPLQTAEGEPERPSDEPTGTGEIITVLQETPHAP